LGTYRTESKVVQVLEDKGVILTHCDLREKRSIEKACSDLRSLAQEWDVLVLCPGSQDPVGLFDVCDFDEWEESIKINFTGQLRIVYELLAIRNRAADTEPCVLFFAGGPVNRATRFYSAYTVSKIALIKMCELLDAEIPDTRFAIIGPGWVKSKIHDATLKAGKELAGENYELTKQKLASNECTPMDRILDCLDWLVRAQRNVVSGRNFSVVWDAWDTEELSQKLLLDFDIYKLRRHGNDLLARK